MNCKDCAYYEGEANGEILCAVLFIGDKREHECRDFEPKQDLGIMNERRFMNDNSSDHVLRLRLVQ